MKRLVAVIAALVSVGLVAGSAAAFSCPSLQKAANEAITQAESRAATVSGDREKARATSMLAEAKDLVKASEANHKDGAAKQDAALHYKAEAEAKAAKALAELVK